MDFFLFFLGILRLDLVDGGRSAVLTLFIFSWYVCVILRWQVAGETETKGQIKLRFKTAAGKDVVCIRSFQLTQKASKMEYKAIESVLQTVNPHTGEVYRSTWAII